MTDRYEALRKALEAGPTPGPWHHDKSVGQIGEVRQSNEDTLCVVQPRAGHGRAEERWRHRDRDAAYIAACDPATIQSLLDDRDSWEQQASERVDDAARFAKERDAALEALALAGKMSDTARALVGGPSITIGSHAPADIYTVAGKAQALREAVDAYDAKMIGMVRKTKG